MSDAIRAAMDAMVAGKDIEQAVYGSSSTAPTPEVSSPTSPKLEAVTQENTKEEAKVPVTDAEVQEAPTGEKPAVEDSDDYITITDEKGKRRVKIDYSNKEQVKKYAQLALGSRKWQAERDQERTAHATTKGEYQKLKQDFGKLEQAFEKQGVRGLFDLLAGPDAWKQAIEAEIKQREYLNGLSPKERYDLEVKEKLDAAKAERESLEARYKSKLEEFEQKEQQAELRSTEAKLHPVFDKYRFSGKLGDEAAEAELDESLWDRSLKRLGQYPEGTELTPALIEKEFRTVAQSFRKVIGNQVEQKVAQTITQKKQVAAKTAEVAAKKGMSTSNKQAEFEKDIKSGNMVGALRAFVSGGIKL